MRLRTVSCQDPGWVRIRHGRGFRYLDQSGAALAPEDRDRVRALVELGGRDLVAAVAHEGEFGFGHARFHARHAHTAAVQVAAQAERKLGDEGLGAAVNVAGGVGITPRDRVHVDDAAAAFDQRRQQLVRERRQRGDVGVDHLSPLREVAIRRLGRAECESGVVDQHVDAAEILRQGIQRYLHRVRVADIERRGAHIRTELIDKAVEAICTARAGDHAPAGLRETSRGGGAESGAGAGDEDGFGGHDDFRSKAQR